MQFKSLIVAVSWLTMAATQAAPAPTTRSLSLQECIELALRHNLDVQIERYGPAIAGFYLKGAYGIYDPAFTLRADHTYLNQPGQFDPQKSNPDFPYDLTTDSFGPGLSGRLPTGLTYDLSAISAYRDARTDFNAVPGTAADYSPSGIRNTNQYSAFAGLTLRQPLLKDFWMDANRQKILVDKKNLKISELTLRWQIMNTVTAVQLAYYDLISASENVRDQERFLEVATELLRETKRRVQVGDLPDLDEKHAESQVETRQADLFVANQDLAEKQNALKVLMTDDFKAWADVNLQPAESLAAVEEIVDRNQSWQFAMDRRPDLSRFRTESDRQSIMVRYHHNQLFPSLDLVGGYGFRGVDNSFEDAVGDTPKNPAYSIGVVLTVPLGNRTARNNYNASLGEKKQGELLVKKMEQAVLAQVDNAIKLTQSAYRRVQSTRQAAEFAKAALEVERKKLKNGVSTSFIVMEHLDKLATARAAQVRSLADYNKALAQLALSEGNALEKNQLSVEVQ